MQKTAVMANRMAREKLSLGKMKRSPPGLGERQRYFLSGVPLS